jgi:hypothetical protein
MSIETENTNTPIDIKNSEQLDPNEEHTLLTNMFNSIMVQNAKHESNVILEDSKSESSSSSSSEDENIEDDRWSALQTLLDSHLLLTKCLFRLIKDK